MLTEYYMFLPGIASAPEVKFVYAQKLVLLVDLAMIRGYFLLRVTIKIIIWKAQVVPAQVVPQQNNTAHPTHKEEEETLSNRNYTI